MPFASGGSTPMLRLVANEAIRLTLGPTCVACQAPLEAPLAGAVCPACWSAVRRFRPPFCHTCGEPVASVRVPRCRHCLSRPPPWSAARSIGPYDEPLKAIVHALKYSGRRTLAPALGALLREAGSDVLDDADAVVPVPLHRWRAMRRGFNQADDLARYLGLPVWHALRRVRRGPPQAALGGDRRSTNVQGAFTHEHPFRSRRRSLRPIWASGPRLVLVDDVMTTGATLAACAEALVAAGAAEVRVLTVARTLERHATPTRRPQSAD